MKPADLFKELIRTFIATILKEYKFTQRRQTFYLKHGENWGLIDFQKSRKSSASSVIFTVNVGTFSGRLLNFYSPERQVVTLSIEDCHWWERIGLLLPEREDKWWLINKESSLEQLGSELRAILREMAIPEMIKHIRDESLRDLWLSGRSPGLTDLQRLLNLSVMLKMLGPAEKSDDILKQLRQISHGKPTAGKVESHLLRLAEVETL